MESSRIFVRGLPPNLGAEEFEKHFSTTSAVTDAKLISHRRIGYVGYKDSNDAAKAVKYFNKSYIRMSRIAVELARPIEDKKSLNPTKLPTPPNDDTPSSGKRKLADKLEKSTNTKLQEFLEVMQPPSKSKIWANEGATGNGANSTTVVESVEVPQKDDLSEEDYEPVPKKRKKSPLAVSPPENSHGQQVVSSVDQVTETQRPDIILTKDSEDKFLPVPSEPALAAFSDVDWLRSRTSRLLGLVDDDDAVLPNPTTTEDNEPDGTDFYAKPHEPKRRTSNAGSQTDEVMLHRAAEIDDSQNDRSKNRIEESLPTNRLFVRNLSYATSEDDLYAYFSRHGALTEVHISTETRTETSKGFAYVEYDNPDNAQTALTELDGKAFQGRLLHILPASAKKDHTLDEYEISKLPLKKQKQIRQKAEAASSTFKWNSMYMNSDAIMSSISNRLGIAKSHILDPTSSEAAVKQAHAETNIIQETKAYFVACGVNLDAFQKKDFSDTAILVKNFSYGTSPEELKNIFEAYGTVKKVLMPPAGTIAIVELDQPVQAKSAFGALAYRKFKDSILFLEKAPKGVFEVEGVPNADTVSSTITSTKLLAADLLEDPTVETENSTATLFVRNLNFTTTTQQLTELFRPLDGFMSARVKTKTDPKRPGQILSMGFGFLEFRTKQQAQAALAAMNGYKLQGHDLVLKASHKAADAAEERRKEDTAKKLSGRRTKIIVKNLPFEASKKDIRSLFGAYGQLRSVRVPRKFDNSTRGFAFADFVTAREAESAMDALRDTHLLGRRLVLDFAVGDAVDPEEEIEKMQKKVGKQADKIAIQKLTSSGRRKFTVPGAEDADDN
ncbi:Multiple RNA-binding domain-containing protein 1 [Xylographa opegraphella]|nr:Multiple RNA-binding domain-containing protein 1 [Xylographa opegraphella]